VVGRSCVATGRSAKGGAVIPLGARSAGFGWPPEGAPKKEREYRFIEGHKKVALIPC
jgi:hypothetical protein